MTILLLALTNIAMLAALALILHKVRRLHIAMFEVSDKLNDIHHESRELYGQIQAYVDLVRLLRIETPLPRLRGWAASPDFLLLVAKHALRSKPNTIFECSSGASTVVLARCAQLNGVGHVYSLEHDPHFADITRQSLADAGVAEWATVIDAPLTPEPALGGQLWYATSAIPNIEDIDMLVIDGPPESTAPLTRFPALPALAPRFAARCDIFADDADRPAERAMIERWKQDDGEALDIEAAFIPAEKGCAHLVVRRRDTA